MARNELLLSGKDVTKIFSNKKKKTIAVLPSTMLISNLKVVK